MGSNYCTLDLITTLKYNSNSSISRNVCDINSLYDFVFESLTFSYYSLVYIVATKWSFLNSENEISLLLFQVYCIQPCFAPWQSKDSKT